MKNTMKKTNIIFWIFTGLFAAFMFLTAIPDMMLSPDAKTFMGHLGQLFLAGYSRRHTFARC
jgi:hypothetical protein